MSKETLNFQTETSELLNLMIHSIYTHKEIFLRELISNGSDAIDKLKYMSLEDSSLLADNKDFKIDIFLSKEDKTIKIIDSGIGMDYDDLISSLGTVAKSGSKAFMKAIEDSKKEDLEVIGQFGVGFYSAFMVGHKVSVATKKAGSDKGYLWTSTGESSYTIEEISKEIRGTEITIFLRDGEEEFLEEFKIRELVKKYSDYIRYPISMEIEREEKVSEDSDETFTTKSMEVLNSQVPLWKKNKSEIKDEEYSEFYQGKFHDWTPPKKHIHFKVEGNIEYTALLFIPSQAPMNFYSKDYEKGLQLYTKNVFIMDKCKDLIPDHFRFIKGLIDSPDLSLNISREILQQDRQLQIIGKNLNKRIKKELLKMLNNERSQYVEFWNTFGIDIKGGIYESYGMKKEELQDLLLFNTTSGDEMTTLKEYVERMKDDQENIYYLAGEDLEALKRMPQLEKIKDKGFEVLLLNERVDEFAIKAMKDFDGKSFKSVTEVNLDLDSEEEKEATQKISEEKKDLLSELKEALSGKVVDVRVSTRLKSSAVCLVSGDNGITFEMEKAFKNIPQNQGQEMKADKILELNPNHDLFKALDSTFLNSKEDLKDFAYILYNQGLLIEGFPIEDPLSFSEKLTKLMVKLDK